MLIVLDTNVLVSAFLKRNSPPAVVLDTVLGGKIRLAVDDRIYAEYTNVLHRPRLNIPPERADAVLHFITYSARWVQCQQPAEFPPNLVSDPGDFPFAEVAICSHAEALITGNMKHFTFLAGSGIKVLLPQEFLTEYRHYL